MGSLKKFQMTVLRYYRLQGRHDLPWRKTRDPYRIMVSEVMLQQTQVSRVLEKYKSFLKKFPTVRALAKAPLSAVLKEWSGLGYNRRGKYLHDAAKTIVAKCGGKVPRDFAALRALPGMGPYTASAIRVFAFGLPDVLIETNIRTALIHHFFLSKSDLHKKDTKVSDAQMITILHEMAALAGQVGSPPSASWRSGPREWHYALMDYGAYLKRIGVKNNDRSKHYVKQSKFEGSLRQARGQILRDIADGKNTWKGERWEKALLSLERDGLITSEGSTRGGSALGRKWVIA